MNETVRPELARPEPSLRYRWLVLISVSLAMFGSCYVYDALNPLGVLLSILLRQREMGPHGHGLETITTATPKAAT